MKKGILAAGAMFALAATAMAGNYAFPSPWNPAGKASSELTQLIAIIWDDNQYSGAKGSGYEPSKDKTAYKDWGYVDGVNPDTAAAGWSDGTRDNPLNIVSTQAGNGKNIGITWAVNNLDVPQTFNMITGNFVNVYTDGTEGTWNSKGDGNNGNFYWAWQNGETKMGYWTGEEYGQPITNGTATDANGGPASSGYNKVPISWGREYRSEGKTGVAQVNQIALALKQAISKGHEIGNHTIDHMETNSVLPGGNSRFANQGFGKWGNEGFDWSVLDTAPWGLVYDEALEYGSEGSALTSGWKVNIGHYLSQQGWEGYIQLSEDWLTQGGSDNLASSKEGGLGYQKSKIFGFRAPRLECNSALYYALKAKNYLYDCGLEEGYETHVDGRNFLWPYTTNNGVRNSWTQLNIGERVFLDTMPEGLWEIPVNCMIVPQDKRQEVVSHWNDINAGLNPAMQSDPMVASTWDGKITGFDFNLWILFGMTKDLFVATMQNTTTLRIEGNRAPLQYGAHTDYYTPIYDNGTLSGKTINQGNYSLSIDRGWNTYVDRQLGTEAWVTWAKQQNNGKVKFVTGKELIDTLSKWNDQGEAIIRGEESLTGLEFVGSTVDEGDLGQNLTFGTDMIVLAKPGVSEQPVFNHIFTDAEKSAWGGKITHLSLDYKSRTAIAIRLLIDANGDGEWNGVYDGDHVREAILAHRYSPIGIDGRTSDSYERGSMRKSGKIPLTSFDFEQNYEGTRNYSSIDQSKILGIQIVPLAPYAKTPLHGEEPSFEERNSDYELKFKIENLKLHTGTPFEWTEPDLPTGIAAVKTNGRTLALAGISANALKLNIATAGKYDVKVFGVNGRLLQSFNAQSLMAGMNTLKLNNLAKGVYLIKVQGINTKQQLTKSAVVL